MTSVVIYHQSVTLGGSTEHFTSNGFKVTCMVYCIQNRPTVCM